MTVTLFRSSVLTAVLLVNCGVLYAQQTSNNFGFVSPNTRDDLRLEDAILGLNSRAEMNLISQARSLGCVVRRKITTRRAIGSWSDGAEHSLLLRVNTDESTIRYLMSRLGRNSNQKAVIYFHPNSRGRARLFMIRAKQYYRGLALISRVMDQLDIAFRTLVPNRRETRVYVIDMEGKLDKKVRRAARRLGARVSSQTGNASLIGDTAAREKGQAAFAQEIKEYEEKHPGLPPPCETKQ